MGMEKLQRRANDRSIDRDVEWGFYGEMNL